MRVQSLTREARRIAANIAKLPELLSHRREDSKEVNLLRTRGSLKTGSQPLRLASALASALIVSPGAQAASLTLGCAGTLTSTHIPKDGVDAPLIGIELDRSRLGGDASGQADGLLDPSRKRLALGVDVDHAPLSDTISYAHSARIVMCGFAF
jgi:hypothetical protein